MSRGRECEALSNNQQIHRLVRKYRAQLDERRKAQLVEQCLQRLFKFFDVNEDGVIHPEAAEWVDSMTLLAEFFEHHSDQSIQRMFEDIDKDEKASYAELLQVINVPFRELMDMLADIDRAILQEKLRLEREAHKEAEEARARAEAAAQEERRSGRRATIKVTQSEVTVATAGTAAVAMKRFRSPVLSPKAKAMSLRRVAIRRHSDHLVAETAEEAMASFAAQLAAEQGDTPQESNPNEGDEEKDHVLPPVPDLEPADPQEAEESDGAEATE
eukprot:g16991.t1